WHGEPHLVHEYVIPSKAHFGVSEGQIPVSPHQQFASANLHVVDTQTRGVTAPGWPRSVQVGGGWPAGWPKSLPSRSSPNSTWPLPHHPPVAQPEELILHPFVHASMPPA